VLKKRIRGQVTIDEMQCGFRPGKGITDGIFVVRQLQEKNTKRRRNCIMLLLIWKRHLTGYQDKLQWPLRKSDAQEWLVSAVMAMHEGARTVVRTEDGDSESFAVKVRLHQGSVLSPMLFTVVMDVITKEIREGLPWEILHASRQVYLPGTIFTDK
jgi:hypothetical protein